MSDETRIIERTTIHKAFAHLEKIVFGRKRRDGGTVELTREILDSGDSASILPYDRARGTIILVRQFRGVAFLKQGAQSLVETCAGKLEGADPVARIVKETEEETGIRLTAEPRRIFEAYSSPGSFAERLTYFVAPYTAADRVTQGGGLVAEGEDIEVIETTLAEAIGMVERGEIIDIKTIAHLYWARATGLMDEDAPSQAASKADSIAARSIS